MATFVSELEPRRLWGHFDTVLATPRASGGMAALKGLPQLAAAVCTGACCALASLLLTAAQDSPEAAIRAARTRFNVAIAAHDTVTLDRDWADDPDPPRYTD